MFSNGRNVALSAIIGTYPLPMFGEQMREPPELLLLYLNCNPPSQLISGSNSEEMLKKYSFNNQLSLVLT